MVNKWYVVYTKPRNEKKVLERLGDKQFEVYCPLQTVVRQWSDRKKKVNLPVISSYVFVKVSEKDRETVLKDPGVLNFVFWLGKPAVVPEEEIERMKYVLKEMSSYTVKSHELKPGQEVKLLSQGFTGEYGVIHHVSAQEATVLLKSIGVYLTLSKELVAPN